MTRSYIVTALKEIQSRNRGRLSPRAVVDTARNPKHPLHKKFDWNDGSAAAKYRLYQARQMIASVTVVCEYDSKPMPAFVSLGCDRHGGGGGYRATEDVLSSAELSQELLKTALAEFEGMRERYSRITELRSVWPVVDRVKKRVTKRRRKAA